MKPVYFIIFLVSCHFVSAQEIVWEKQDRSIVFTLVGGQLSTSSLHRVRLTPYGDFIFRVQTVRGNEDFFADDHYEMVQGHEWPGQPETGEAKDYVLVNTPSKNGIAARLDKNEMTLSFFIKGSPSPFLRESERTTWEEDTIRTKLVFDANEHFTGLGHGYFGRESSLDLAGKVINRNYGNEHSQQAPLIVPFYLSSKGYGVFLNSSFPNEFNFGKNKNYAFSLTGDGRMDYFVILGPAFSDILNRYTTLTGRPVFPPKAFFGLALSDKGNDHNSADPSDEHWWKNKVSSHRSAGFPLDHIVNDNRWRAGGGQRCISYFDWDKTRYPDPAEYANWLKTNGLISTLDFNRCIAVQSEGWKPSFNLPDTKGIEFSTSAPDLTKKEVRDWFWNLVWSKSLNPGLHYPGDALWIDEFDEMGKAPPGMKFENGTTWQEMKNYWFFLVAKALVQEGWYKGFNGSKRPFVWVRGMTAGGQRYATLWSGDIRCDYDEMKNQVRAMQLAGLSGFPFWGHDAGGFNPSNDPASPGDSIYRQWSMALGSFTPFWKPHGTGKSRWPLDRGEAAREDAKKYASLRYELIPYIYTYAHKAAQTGLPLARAMVIDYPNEQLAWKNDLQYMWGNEILVAPNCSAGNDVKLWLPPGNWFNFNTDELIKGGRLIQQPAPLGVLPLFIKQGSIIPMVNFALSTAFIHDDSLNIHVYPGKDANFELYEDDGVTEQWTLSKAFRLTTINFNQASYRLEIIPATGSYKNAATARRYMIIFHGAEKPFNVEVNGIRFPALARQNMDKGVVWDEKKKLLVVYIPKTTVSTKLVVKKKI